MKKAMAIRVPEGVKNPFKDFELSQQTFDVIRARYIHERRTTNLPDTGAATATSASLILIIAWPSWHLPYFTTSSSHQQSICSTRFFGTCLFDNAMTTTMAATEKDIPLDTGAGSFPPMDVLTATASELQGLLETGHVRSVDLVGRYLSQIEEHNHKGLKLNAMISTTPRETLLRIAGELDREREEGRVRGRLHGIPITIKDSVMTGPEFGMPTTVGTYALEHAVAKQNAPIVDKLIKAGAIIIGKANLSTQSPYIVGGFKEGAKILDHSAPAGSSSGSAAGVAAGFAPLALAPETDGSIVQPANRAALYGLKTTVGLLPTQGTSPTSSLTDSPGGMAKSSADLAALIDILADTNYSEDLTGLWKGLRVGFVDPLLWTFSPVICDPDDELTKQQREEMAEAISKIEKSSGEIVTKPVPFPSMDDLVLDKEDALEQLWNHDSEREWDEFLKGYENSEVKTLKDMVRFNGP
ncbi:amidase signature domain-containing protein [Xylariaceae sp. FL0594]|nr:amidase signature domain-containing protein [Xylariaceae sp. FL0594]